MRRVLLLTLVASLALVAAGCGGSGNRSSHTTSTRTLTDLHDVDQLKRAFNTASGEPRLIVIVSPT